jgi:hypothetical protein
VITIVLAEAKGGKREFSFKSGKDAAKWCWENKINFFTDLNKSEQRD